MFVQSYLYSYCDHFDKLLGKCKSIERHYFVQRVNFVQPFGGSPNNVLHLKLNKSWSQAILSLHSFYLHFLHSAGSSYYWIYNTNFKCVSLQHPMSNNVVYKIFCCTDIGIYSLFTELLPRRLKMYLGQDLNLCYQAFKAAL